MKNKYAGEGSPKLPKKQVKNVRGNDKLRKAVGKLNKGKNTR